MPGHLDYLAAYRFDGDIDGYPEGELYFPEFAGADRHRLLRHGSDLGDAGALDSQPRLRHRVRGGHGWSPPRTTGR